MTADALDAVMARDQSPADAIAGIAALLDLIDPAPDRDGLADTPHRVVRAFVEMTAGYEQDPEAVLGTVFDETSDEMVVVDGVDFVSLCEHHLMPFVGIAVVGYIPDGKVVGLSKIPRLVDVFARRLQVQERLTNQIADALVDVLQPKGVGVIVRAAHACMSTRGVNVQGSVTTTSAMRGVVLEKPAARAEFLALCEAADRHR